MTDDVCELCAMSGNVYPEEYGEAIGTLYAAEDEEDMLCVAGKQSMRVCADCIDAGLPGLGQRLVLDNTSAS